jgi:hypothetical protein
MLDRAIRKSILRHERKYAAQTSRRWLSEDEGPLPEDARAEILSTTALFAEVGNDVLGLGGKQGFLELHAFFVARSLWERRFEVGEPGATQAFHLIERIVEFVKERGPRWWKSPSDWQLRERFRDDRQVVQALWPCARVLILAHASPSLNKTLELWSEYGELCRIFSSLHLVRAGQSMAAPPGIERSRFFRNLEATVRKRSPRGLEQSPAATVLDILFELKPRLLRNYTPQGNIANLRGYITVAVSNKLRDRALNNNNNNNNNNTISQQTVGESLHNEHAIVAASTLRKKERRDRVKHMSREEILLDIEHGRSIQRHRDPKGRWLTLGQCHQRLAEANYTMSFGTVRTAYRRAVAAGTICERLSGKTGGKQLSLADLKVLERMLARFHERSVAVR